ncbi:MAG: helix-turn-helix domain-containing protein [Treponema sp.]|nr:helix-turn-helix domain-containing protein [Treponema sp.]
MDSLGEKLRQAREEKACTLEQVSRDTNIATRYLQALEMEDFSGFPGEPYILGFLRNYSEYLGLDVQEQLSRYRALKIQEQPVPVEQLLHSPVPVRKIILSILIPLAVLGLGAGVYYFITHRPVREQAPVVEARQPAEYAIETGVLERRFYVGDSILVSLGEVSYKLTLTNLGEALTITSPLGQLMLDLGQEVLIDLNSDGVGELRIVVSDFARNDSAAGAMLRYELIAGVPGFVDTVPVEEILATAMVIQSSANPYPFTAQLNFQGYCMLRWEILFERDRPDRNEQYFQRGEELNIQAQNGIRVWASNAQAVRVQVIGGGRTMPVELGGAGEVVAADIRWDRDADNRYRLILVRLN